MAATNWATCQHTISHQNDTCQMLICQLSTILPRVIQTATSAAVRTVQSTSIFLHVCHCEQNVISLTPNVRLNPNELRWVHNNEAYALV
jgi:hypothetical protein